MVFVHQQVFECRWDAQGHLQRSAQPPGTLVSPVMGQVRANLSTLQLSRCGLLLGEIKWSIPALQHLHIFLSYLQRDVFSVNDMNIPELSTGLWACADASR